MMTNVYVVMMNYYEENILLGVFSTRELAESYIKTEYTSYHYNKTFDTWDGTAQYDISTIDITEVAVDEGVIMND